MDFRIFALHFLVVIAKSNIFAAPDCGICHPMKFWPGLFVPFLPNNVPFIDIVGDVGWW
jgi:hypothetical protein